MAKRLGGTKFFSYFIECLSAVHKKMSSYKTSAAGEPEFLEKYPSDERSLFCRIASGEEQAFRQIFERLRPRLLSYLTRITKSREDAEELTQEVFLKLWSNRECLADVEEPQQYIFAIARNKAIDYLRKAALDSRVRQNLWDSIRQHRASTEDQVSANDSDRLIKEAILKLSSQKQVVFKLSRIEGLTHDQIASQLKISKNTVKNHIVASLKFIRHYLVRH